MAGNPTETLDRPKPKLRCIIKLGGAAITHKNELESINEESLGLVCSHLRAAMERSPAARAAVMDWSRRSRKPLDVSDLDPVGEISEMGIDSNFIVVHGAGSFGHFHASRSGVHKGGLHLPLVKAGFVATRISVTSLNLEIVRALAQEGIPAVGMSPFACGWSTRERNVASPDISQLVMALKAGFVPVLHGDAVLDELQDCTILSGDEFGLPMFLGLSSSRLDSVFCSRYFGSRYLLSARFGIDILGLDFRFGRLSLSTILVTR